MAAGINLFVAPLSKNVDDLQLKHEFEKFGDLFRADVVKDENGDSKSYGFVHFCSVKDGLRAKEEMTGRMFCGLTLNVELAKAQGDGRFYNESSRNSMWAAEWDDDSPFFNQDDETAYDGQSQISDVADEQNDSEKWDVKERMKRLFETQCYTDVTFYPKNKHNASISAHKAVLAVGSPLFTKMLFGDDSKDNPKMEVEISNLAFDAFTNIVKFLYTDEVFFENDSSVQEILEGAEQFGIKPLVNRCKRYFESVELTDQNACTKLQMSTSNKINVLKERCIEFIQRNTCQVFNSVDFETCSASTVRAICKLQSLNLRSEMELLNAVMNWLRNQPPQNRKQSLEPLLKCIRFLTFSVTELGDALKMYENLMIADEGLQIMLYLYNPPKNPDFRKLPSWCNKNTTSRCFFTESPGGRSMEPDAGNSSRALAGRLLFPLKHGSLPNVSKELTSLLQLKCIGGHHIIKAIRLTFEKPMSDESIISDLTINVHCHPSNFKTSEKIEIVNSESVRVQFSKRILARRGDLVDIDAYATNIKSYRFLQFDDTCQVTANPHFQCCISSRPKLGKLYFISEIEYGPQVRYPVNFKPNFSHRQRRY